MDPVTHFLTGACLGRAGLNRRTAYATLAATLAAEAPDIDVAWGWFGGPVTGFAHHRGFTHTFAGAPVMALIITGLVWAWSRVRPPGTQPVRWLWVFGAALLADASHLLLDWTNNYGIRPFYPWSPRWYSLDLVFIIEPVLLLLLLAALGIPALLGLVDREVGARHEGFRGRGWAAAALVGMTLLWTLRYAEHAHALALASEAGALGPERILRVAAEPYPVNPFRWHIVAETPARYLPAEVWTWPDRLETSSDAEGVPKAPVTPAVAAAKRSHLGQVYESWSTWPLTEDLGLLSIPAQELEAPRAGWHTVRFSDMRFSYSFLGRGAPLAAWAYVDAAGKVEAEVMNGKPQH